MSKEKIDSSPLTRRKLTLGAAQPPAMKPEDPEAEHNTVDTSKPKDAKTSSEKSPNMKRVTVYMSEDLAIELKVYAARHKQDVSGIIIKQMERFLAEEE